MKSDFGDFDNISGVRDVNFDFLWFLPQITLINVRYLTENKTINDNKVSTVNTKCSILFETLI